MLQANFTVSPLSGFVLGTEFTVTNLTSGGIVEKYNWDFGTGDIFYNNKTPSYIYKYPGMYTVSLTAINFDGVVSTYTQVVTADIVFRDYIKFTHIPERFADPGKLTLTPFKFEVVSSNPDKPLVIDLFVSNSNSTPYQFATERWESLTPTWKFLNNDLTPITSLSVEPIPIYVNNTIVAVSGLSEFYFIDSTSTGNPTQNCPLLITATLQTSSFANFQDSSIYPYESHANNKTVRAGVIWQVNDLTPTLLKVTGNYIDPINTKQWKDIKIPVLITAHSNRAQILPGSDENISEVIFTYPGTNNIGKLAPIALTLSNIPSSAYIVDEAPLFFQATDKNDLRSGGYIFTTLTSYTTATNVSITAQTTAFTNNIINPNEFPYPYGFAPNTSVWVSNPQRNTLNKITLVPDIGTCNTINYFRENNILTDGIIKEVQVPALSTTNTFNYTMSGFSGIYGVAIDPRNYELVAADAELDCLYRFSNTGELLKTFSLSCLGDFDPQKKLFETWTWTTPAPETSSTRFAFYKPVPLSPNPNNYIVTVGGNIQPTDLIEIYPYQGIIRLNVFNDPLVPENQDAYPPENLEFNVIQLFNPSLPQKYISSITHWTTRTTSTNTTFPLTGFLSLSADSNYYVVSLNGVLLKPDLYTINNITKTITFNQTVPTNTVIHILYIPNVLPPATWFYTFSETTTSVNLTGNLNYQPDEQSAFIVNINGVLQNTQNFKHNVFKQTLDFNTPLPLNEPIQITQFSITDTINNTAAYTPAYVSLDKDYNIWVSLFNSVSVLKFDPNFNLLFNVVPSGIKWLTRSWTTNPIGIDYQSARFEEISRMFSLSTNETVDDYTNEYFLKPPVVETDKDNNCWVTYANPLCSMLVKFDSLGNELAQITLNKYATPINLAVNSQNNIWVSNFHGSSYTYTSLSGSIQLYDSNTLQLLQSVQNISRPGYIALDRNNNLWFTHSLRRIGYYNTTTNTLCAWTVEESGNLTIYIPPSSIEATPETFDSYENEHDEELGGLAVDVYNRVWVLDSLYNFAYVISATPNFFEAPIRKFKILPDSTLGYYLDIDSGSTYTKISEYNKSAQATGDWTGNRWYQKYANPQAISAVLISGISIPFNITEFINKHQIKKINESFNAASYYKSLALPENLNSNTKLFDSFFPAVVGTSDLSSNEDVGQITYEKIANFVINHADIDTCNIDQLLSLADQTAVAASDYAATYPTDIRNMLDIASISRSKLWGIKDNTPILTQSLGQQLNTLTDLLTAGTKIILKNKYNSSLSVIEVPTLSTNQTTYTIDKLKGYGLAEPIIDNYLFYIFNPAYTEEYIENIIDWTSSYTTQSFTASTLEEWYGEDGAIETAFRYLLTKNLFLK
jgi:hypothetical protein